ncbi:MAG: Asp-tRNA(Asn)/Glu-tRNA(Gln) amidotransferase subunit GatA [Desulfatiglandales bacterium]
MKLYEETIHSLHKRLIAGEISSADVTESVFQRIDAVEEKVNGYITLTREEAFIQADEADRRIRNGERNALLGIPIALKDILCTKGILTTCGSKILSNFIPPYDATVVEKLRREGAVFTGKTNMDEFAKGSSTEYSSFGPTRNPWDLERIPGGSSGGSAAIVAADACIAAIGSDTGGSIRQPAACCGIVGLKPTYGRVSRFGLVAFASSLDQIGPMTKDVEDCAILLEGICGHDPRDSTSVSRPVLDFAQFLKRELKGIRVGIPEKVLLEGMDREVDKTFREAIANLVELGVEIKEISIPHAAYALASYYLIAPAEASSNLARYDGVKYGFRQPGTSGLMEMYMSSRSQGFGPEVKRRIMLGTYALSAGYYEAYYKKACQVRTLLLRDFERVFGQCDVVVMPTTPTPAFLLGEKLSDPLQMYLSDVFTIPVNMAGLPGISIPCGFSKDGLPIGLQIIANHFEEEKVIQTAYAFEQSTDFHRKRPSI